MRSGVRASVLALALLSWLAGVHPATAVQLITNGGFESGLTGWTVSDQPGSGGTWIATSSFAPSGISTVGPLNGSMYALTVQTGPGAQVLFQDFTVDPDSKVTLSFGLFADNFADVTSINPAGLDYNATPNQHVRVDILSSGSSAFDTGSGVLQNFYLGTDAGATPHPYTVYTFDISGLVGQGGTFTLRIGEVDNQSYLLAGVDDVSIAARPAFEPGAALLLGAALTSIAGGSILRRRPR